MAVTSTLTLDALARCEGVREPFSASIAHARKVVSPKPTSVVGLGCIAHARAVVGNWFHA